MRRAENAGSIGLPGAEWSAVIKRDIEPLAAAGVLGFKCFLIHPGIGGFTMVTEQDLRAALPHVARTGLPLLVHAELERPGGRGYGSIGGRRLEIVRDVSEIAAR